ncbi:hypothetical protein LTR85_006853 [Meristemomyces frigidus]|nr:hypothetical protein LTR85_006853 [Meristemomyces frigidus]
MAATKSKFLNVDTMYRSVSSSMTDHEQNAEEQAFEPKMELGSHPQMVQDRAWSRTLILQFLSLLWLNRIHKFDKENHNLLGALQLVAKALEIWFELIAVALVYIVTMLLAARPEGLPVGYLTRPSEFAEIPGLLDALLWSSLPRRRHKQPYNKRGSRIRVWAFIIMSLALCILCNLMGPATAVLVIPSLQWLDTPKVSKDTFTHLNSATPALASRTAFAYTDEFDCTTSDFGAYNYSCAADDWSDRLDTWMTSWVTAAREGSYNTLAWEYDLTFTVNSTSSINASDPDQYASFIYWVPSRQLVKTFNDDVNVIAEISQGVNASGMYTALGINLTTEEYDGYKPYNKSLQLELQRNGPILGTYPNMWFDGTGSYSWTTMIDSGRSLHCFAYYRYGYARDGNYTKCIPDGGGWGADFENTKYANFTVEGAHDSVSNKIGPVISYEIFSSDKVAFLDNGALPAGISADCLVNGTVSVPADCNYDLLFDAAPPAANATEYVTTIRMTMSNGTNVAVLAVDYVAYLNFTSYTIDPSLLTNPLLLVQTASTPSGGVAVPVNPAWTLAAWSADNGGTLASNRSATILLHKIMQDVLDQTLANSDETNAVYYMDAEYQAVTALPVLETLSMIEYMTRNTMAKKITKAMIDDPNTPVLYRNANMYVWAYGMSSRTAYLGVLVAILGCMVVLTQFVLGLVSRRRYRSPTQLLVAALEHAPKGEFDGREHDEAEMARVRFHIQDAAHTAGKFSFHPPL